MTKSILKRTYSSLHEHDDGKHHAHEHDHCEHHEHEHPVHEQDNWVHHRHEQHNVWHNEPDDWAHIIHEYLLNEQAYSEQQQLLQIIHADHLNMDKDEWF